MEDIYGAEAELTSAKGKQQEEGKLIVDVYQNDSEVIIKSTIAGVSKEDIDISVTKEMVVLKGTRVSEENVKKSNYYHQEIYWGPFSRSIILPVDIDPDKSKAMMKNGILTIRLPKLQRTKKVAVE